MSWIFLKRGQNVSLLFVNVVSWFVLTSFVTYRVCADHLSTYILLIVLVMAQEYLTEEVFDSFFESKEDGVIEQLTGGSADCSREAQPIAATLIDISKQFEGTLQRAQTREIAEEVSRQSVSPSDMRDIIHSVVKGSKFVKEAILVVFHFSYDTLKCKSGSRWERVRNFFSACKNTVSNVITKVVNFAKGWMPALKFVIKLALFIASFF
ncbi:uncharacterized protein LOC131940016 [Physella acuta]|uniref:uncharacterized protein LOC131940016 n=1 Tax=Physella acuta TaxID=109671 RepID=UPI0027DAFC88|nr:uncharacterized protein LOC131940016 [Physella acuta]